MRAKIVKVAELLRACPSCGSDSRGYEIEDGPISPIIGFCLDCGTSWSIRRQTHAFGRFFTVAVTEEPENAEKP